MPKFFKQFRKKMIDNGKVSRYLLYAVGEILLVMIGILLAFQVNSWSSEREDRLTEIKLLTAIKGDLLADTVDINFNIDSYQDMISKDSALVSHLLNQKENSNDFATAFYELGFTDLTLVLHRSAYKEAQNEGLAIITNDSLRSKINRLYEFDYPYLLYLENDYEPFNSTEAIREVTSKYLKAIQSKKGKRASIRIAPYDDLLADSGLHFQILMSTSSKQQLLKQNYIPLRKKILSICDAIDEELTRLD